MCTLDTAHQAMARAIFTCPGVIIHSLVRPGAQCFYRHEIGEHYFSGGTGKPRLEYIAAPEVALRSRNGLVGRSYLEKATALSIEQAREQGWTIKVR